MSNAQHRPQIDKADLCALLLRIENLAQIAAQGFCDPQHEGPNTQTLLREDQGQIELTTRISGEDKDPRKDAHHILARRSIEDRLSRGARTLWDMLRAQVPALGMNAHSLILISTGPVENIQFKLLIGDLWKSSPMRSMQDLSQHLLHALERVADLPAPTGRKFIVGMSVPISAVDPNAAMRLYAAFEKPWLFDPTKQYDLTNVPILEHLDGPAAARSLLAPYTPIS